MGSNKEEKLASKSMSNESLEIPPIPKPNITDFVDADDTVTHLSQNFPVHPPPITSTPDMKTFGYGMNLSRISERTEFTDWSKSELDKTGTTNSTYRPDILTSLSEKQKSVDITSRSSKHVMASAEKESSSPKTRSVFLFLLGCLFPFCKIKI